MLKRQLLLLTFISLLVVVATNPLDEDDNADDGLADINDGHLGYDNYRRYKREVDADVLSSGVKIPKCPAGQYFGDCLECPIGTFKPNKARKYCTKCADGKWTPKEGSKWCTKLCKAGEKLIKDAKKERECAKCDIGSYQPEPNVNSSCIQCPIGFTTKKTGSTNKTDCFLNCLAGMQPNGTKTGCEKCPRGTFSTNEGMDLCKICSNNKTTLEVGATTADQCFKPCGPGKLLNVTDGKCNIRCERGTYKDEYSLDWKECKQCPKNSVPNKNGAATGCVAQCGPGYEINTMGNNCSACRFGYYKTNTENTGCEKCPGSQLTKTRGATAPESCQNFNPCASQLIGDLESLYQVWEQKKGKSGSLIEMMVTVCSYGPYNTDVQLLESVVSRFPTCGAVGQLDLYDLEVGGKMYKKENYLQIYKEASQYGGLCNFLSCLDRIVPEIKKSKSWIRNDTCSPKETRFCSDTYRALATSVHTNLQRCPALQFHPEFLAMDIGGKEMIESLLQADNITAFCALSNDCATAKCRNGSCSSQPGGYKCKCYFGYTGDHCETAVPVTEETEPETTTHRTTPDTTSSPNCPPPKPCPPQTCPTPEPPPPCTTASTSKPVECNCATKTETTHRTTPDTTTTCPPPSPCPMPTCPTPEPPPPCTTTSTLKPAECDCATKTGTPSADTTSGTTASTQPSTSESHRCQSCNRELLEEYSTLYDICSDAVADKLKCFINNDCSSSYMYHIQALHTRIFPNVLLDFTSSESAVSSWTNFCESETSRCNACDSRLIAAYGSSNNICSSEVIESLGCFLEKECSQTYFDMTISVLSSLLSEVEEDWTSYQNLVNSISTSCNSETTTPESISTPTKSSPMTTTPPGFGPECDPRQPSCENGMYCVTEWNSNKAYCRCIMFGRDETTGMCKASSAMLGENCDPDAVEPCQYNMECNTAATTLLSTCECKRGYTASTSGECETDGKVFLYSPCDTDEDCGPNMACFSDMCNCQNETYISPDGLTCEYADGMVLGGHCHLYDICYVEHSKCNFKGHTCTCKFGYEQVGDNRCERIADVKEECSWMVHTCTGANEECFWEDVLTGNHLEAVSLCDCKVGFKRNAEWKCELDPLSCTSCLHKFDAALLIPASRQGCSENMTTTIECFSQRCSEYDFEIHRYHVNQQLFEMNGHYNTIMTLLELKQEYDQYCDGYLLERACQGGMCHIQNSFCDQEGPVAVCRCIHSFTKSSASSHCLWTQIPGSEEECDNRKHTCIDMRTCVLDTATKKASCQCAEYGRDFLTGQCRTSGALLNEYCDHEALYPCMDGLQECNKTDAATRPTCQCKQGYRNNYGYCDREHSVYFGDICDPNAIKPCENDYELECKQFFGAAYFTCGCKDEFQLNSGGWCEKRNGTLYMPCEHGMCIENLKCDHGQCYCKENYTSYDQTTCVYADGRTLGGRCHNWDWCHVDHSICDYKTHTCRCGLGYKDSGSNTCSRIPDLKEECLMDNSNCKAEHNKECTDMYVRDEGKIQMRRLCECKTGFQQGQNDKCELDPSSCASCSVEFEKIIYAYTASSQHGCSQNMSNVIRCFTENCGEEEYQHYREDLNLKLFMYSHFSETIFDLTQIYENYCAGHIIGHMCESTSCYVPNAVCVSDATKGNICQCLPTYTVSFEASSCLSRVLVAIHCENHFECHLWNAVCLNHQCVCPEGYPYDVYRQRCVGDKHLHDKCDLNLASPCNDGSSWLPRCLYNKETGFATCECWSYGMNVTSMKCADYPARPGELCNQNGVEICEFSAECDRESGKCKCKDGYKYEFGYCMFDDGSVGILNQPCDGYSCKGENVECSGDNMCSCISGDYYQNTDDHNCYRVSDEDGELGSPCLNSMTCNDDNAWCAYLHNDIQRCFCHDGYIAIDGLCVRDPDDCLQNPCNDENAVCQSQEFFQDGRHTYENFCICKYGYGRDELSGKCEPVNCDGCYQEFLKITDYSRICQKKFYDIMQCATEKHCSTNSNFGKILSSDQLRDALPNMDSFDLDSFMMFFKGLCDGTVAGESCGANNWCDVSVGLECASEDDNGQNRICLCTNGKADYFGQCTDVPPPGDSDEPGDLWGPAIPGMLCDDDYQCESSGGKCDGHQCRCTARQMLDGSFCIYGSCPATSLATDGPTTCGNGCYTNDQCPSNQICCPDATCIEHCVLPFFHTAACDACVEEFYRLDLSTELCQLGGYNVDECSSTNGCNEQTRMVELLSSQQLLLWGLDLTSLDSLGHTYGERCDGKVAGGHCNSSGQCDSSLGLVCREPDLIYPSENRHCECEHGGMDDIGRCIDFIPGTHDDDLGPQVPLQGLTCNDDSTRCDFLLAKCSQYDGLCYCLSGHVFSKHMCINGACAACMQDLQEALYGPAEKLGCSRSVSNAIDCFLDNCNTEEYQTYSNDLADMFLGSGYYASNLEELQLVYYEHYCADYLLNHHCKAELSPCEITNSICEKDATNTLVCHCAATFSEGTENNCIPEGASGDDGESSNGFKRTVILMHFKSMYPDDQLFIRGGLDHNIHNECESESYLCEIPIKHRSMGSGDYYDRVNSWSENDNFLDWGASEPAQGTFDGQAALGTPTVRTTNLYGEGFSYLNTYGVDYWLVDFYMDCEATPDNGWFDLKGYVKSGSAGHWENQDNSIMYINQCYDGPNSRLSYNHKARCGMMNVLKFEDSTCEVKAIPPEPGK